MQLFYTEDLFQSTFNLSETESKHCAMVLRKRIGDEIHVTNGLGDLALCEIILLDKKSCTCKIVQLTKGILPVGNVTLAVALTKQMERFEWMVEKATEIGVQAIIPLVTNRNERSDCRVDRIEKVAMSAMKQSNHLFLPKIFPVTKFGALIKSSFDINLKYLAHCQKTGLPELGKENLQGKKILIAIGPEGDFDLDEIKIAEENQWQSISLGKSRLRTETAGLYACLAFHLRQL